MYGKQINIASYMHDDDDMYVYNAGVSVCISGWAGFEDLQEPGRIVHTHPL